MRAMLSLMLMGSAAALIAAAPAPERRLPVGQTVQWKPDSDPPQVRYRAGALEVRLVRAKVGGDDDTMYGPDVTISSPGKAAARIEGDRSGLTFPTRLTALRWNKAGDLYLLVETYTGGAHCCDHVQAAVPTATGFHVVDLGTYDGDRIGQLPRDIDGDGIVDFLVRDDRFLYAFSSYAESLSPPKILNLRGGEAVDVSERPSYRPVFAKAAARLRRACLPRRGGPLDGACPAYVAAAARAGDLDRAWKDVSAAYSGKKHDPMWLPEGCTLPLDDDGACPKGSEITYRSYLEALRAFLVTRGYITR